MMNEQKKQIVEALSKIGNQLENITLLISQKKRLNEAEWKNLYCTHNYGNNFFKIESVDFFEFNGFYFKTIKAKVDLVLLKKMAKCIYIELDDTKYYLSSKPTQTEKLYYDIKLVAVNGIRSKKNLGAYFNKVNFIE